MKKGLFVMVVAVLLAFILFGNAPQGNAQASADLYKSKCATCHAIDGSGNVPAGKALKVRDIRDPEVQKMTEEQMIEVTAKGKNKMPAYEKSLKPEQIKALVAHMRELAKKEKPKS